MNLNETHYEDAGGTCEEEDLQGRRVEMTGNRVLGIRF